MATKSAWPNGKKIAVSVTVMFETWSEDAAPNYSVQTTHLKSGTVDYASKAWSTYGGRVGVWRLIRMLDRLQIPGTFFTNGRCVEEYPDAVRQIAKSGHDIAGHAYVQDQLLAYMSLEDQQKTIQRSVELLSSCSGKKITGWSSPVIAFTPETAGFLAKAGLKWTCDVTYADLPIRIHTPHGVIAGVPTTDFSDNRVMRASPRDLFDAYKGTFDYLSENEQMSLLVLVIHCQFGGRPLMTAVVQEILKYIGKSPDVWFARHEELANWALAEGIDEHSYRERYFA
ncbi:MAG: polysaccharide deacetylase family protein [Xanthobacteraceae bacterium]